METRAQKKRRLIEEANVRNETPTEQLMAKALSIDLILKQVFLHLPRSDLLICSLVNRKWNLNARCSIRDKTRCLAKVPLDSYQSLRSFKGILMNSFNLPYNGVAFHLTRHRDRCPEENQVDIKKIELIPWEKMKIRHVSIVDEKFNTWCAHSLHIPGCQSVLMLHQIWPRISLSIENLIIRSISLGLSFQGEDGGLLCPNVQTIEWPSVDIDEPYFESVLLSTPRLQELTSDVSQYSLPVVMKKKKTHLVKKLRIFNAQHITVINFAYERPKLKKISFSHCHYNSDFNPSIVGHVLEGLLSSSLRELKMNYPEMLFWSRICRRPLFNLRHLTVTYSNQSDDRYGFQHMNFGRVFPNLKSITFQPGCKPCRPPSAIQTEFLEIFGGVPNHNTPSVSRLEYWNSGGFYDRVHNYIEPNLIRSLAQIFPNVTYFIMGGNAWNLNLELVFSSIWTVWEGLERIKFVSTDNEMLSLIESSIVGVSREELAYWKVIPGLDAKNMQFAPSRPNIRDCSKLNNFSVFIPRRFSVLGMEYPTYVRVDGPAPAVRDLFPWASPLAFDRLSTLSVEIYVYKSR